MYSPRISEDHLKRLFKLKKAKKLPMTKMVAEAIEAYLVVNEITEQKKGKA